MSAGSCPKDTVFAIYTDEKHTTLTVIEGDLEFSNLKGDSVIVKDNQACSEKEAISGGAS